MERFEIELNATNQRAQIREHLPTSLHITPRAAFGGGCDMVCTDWQGEALGSLLKVGDKTFLIYYKQRQKGA